MTTERPKPGQATGRNHPAVLQEAASIYCIRIVM